MQLPEQDIEFQLGEYVRSKSHAIKDERVVNVIDAYRARVLKQLRSIHPSVLDELAQGRGHEALVGDMDVSVKIDGINAYAVYDEGTVYFCNTPYHRAWLCLPAGFELAAILGERGVRQAIVVGELFAAPLDDTGTLAWNARSFVSDVMTCQMHPSGREDLDRIGFKATDLIEVDGQPMISFSVPGGINSIDILDGKVDKWVSLQIAVRGMPFNERMARLQDLLPSSGRVAVVQHHVMQPGQLAGFFDAVVVNGGHEGLVVRVRGQELGYKIKMTQELDVAIIGLVPDEQLGGAMGSALLAVMRRTGEYVVIGQAGVGMSMAERIDVVKRSKPAEKKGVHLGRDAAVNNDRWDRPRERGSKATRVRQNFMLVKPSIVVMVNAFDLFLEKQGEISERTLLIYDEKFNTWLPGGKIQFPALGAAWFPSSAAIRHDKDARSFFDVRDTQFDEHLARRLMP